MAQELHGIFQFQDFETAIEKPEIEIDRNYVPFQATPGYFFCDTTTVMDRDGPSRVHKTIDYLYMKKEYQQCYQLCLEWIQYNKTLKKPSKGGEVVEAGIRSCLKLHWFKEALELVECLHKDNSREPGIVFVRAKVYRLNGLYVKAIELYLEYLKIRNNDYLGWLELAKLFQPISIDWTCVLVDVAMELVNGSHRPDTIFSKLHKEKELGEMVLLCESPRPLELDSAVLKRIGLEQNQIDVFISLLSSNSSIKVQ